MTKNFDQFCSKFLYESLRNSWNPERFMRVIPRDLFNEAKMLAMVSKFAKDVNQGKMPGGFIGKLNKKWTVALSEDGELYISGFDLTYKGQKAHLTMNYNAGKTYRFPLQVTVENMDLYSVSIYDENGELDSDMRQFQEAPSPGKIDIPDWSSTIEELKRLGRIGLNNNLNDDSNLIPKDDSRGFADSFKNGKITNVKFNNNIIENFDRFCFRFLYESVNDNEYLAAIERGDMEKAQRMVDEAAKAAGYNVGPVWHYGPKGIKEFRPFAQEFRTGDKTKEQVNSFISRAREGQRIGTMDFRSGTFFSPKHGDYASYGPEEYKVFLKVENAARRVSGQRFKADIPGKPFDAIMMDMDGDGEIKEIAIIDPYKIKSANPVTYDNNGKIIPLSQRFDSSKEDIRY